MWTNFSPIFIDLILGLHEQGSTILMITHDLHIASRLPRHVTLVDGGLGSDSRTLTGAAI